MTRRKDHPPGAEADLTPPATTETDAAPVAEAAPAEVAPFTADVSDREPDPIPEPPVAVVAPPPPKSGLIGALLGGALAAIGGFALSHFDLLGLAAPGNDAELAKLSSSVTQAQADQTAALAGLDSKVAALADRLSTLEAAPAAADPSGLDALDQRLSAIEAMPTDGTASSTALTAKVADLERRLSAVAATDPGSLQDELNAALARLDAAEAAASTQAAEAEATTASARRTQALDALGAAVADGRPFAAELEALADEKLSLSLGPQSAAGVPTLAALQADFPDAARAALRVSRETDGEGGWSDRLVNFFAAQTGARPVAPMEGTSPGAILSRADFALSEGRVADALTEVGALDAAVKAPMETWIAAATSHVAAASALATARGE